MPQRTTMRSRTHSVLLACVLGPVPCFAQAADADAVKKAVTELQAYDYGKDHGFLNVLDTQVAATAGNKAARRLLEDLLLGVLTSDAKPAAKHLAYRHLSVIGSARCVDTVAGALGDDALGHMARYVLERLPEPAAAAALRGALGQTTGKARIGVIGSLGVRGDKLAVPLLVPLLKADDAPVAGAAATALGAIATPEAAAALLAARSQGDAPARERIDSACLRAAERLLHEGQRSAAADVYRRLHGSQGSDALRLAAFRGLVESQPDRSADLLKGALAKGSPDLRAVAASLVRDLPDTGTATELAGWLTGLPPEGQVALLGALAGRGDRAARTAVLSAAASEEERVRVASFSALAALGSPEDAMLLANAAAAGKGADGGAARTALWRMAADGVDAAIIAGVEAPETAGAVRLELVRSLGGRFARQGLPVLLRSATAPDAGVRRAALEAIGMMAEQEEVDDLVRFITAAKDKGDRQAAEKALVATCSRLGSLCAAPMVTALDGADAESRCCLIRALGRARGEAALAAVRSATKAENGDVRTAGVRVLSEWPDTNVADDLLAIATTSEDVTHHVLALRGYVRLIGSDRRRKAEAKAEALAAALKLARRPDEERLVLGELGKAHCLGSFRTALDCLDKEALRKEAASALVTIAGKLKLSKAEDKQLVAAGLASVLEIVKDAKTRKDAEKLQAKFAK